MAQISDKSLAEFKALCGKEGIKYDTEEEYRKSANNLVNYVDTLVKMDKEERQRKNRLEKEPKGFSLEGNGRSCSLCRRTVHDGNGWYDKWGFKCMNCQSAVDKRKIPGSMCGDWKNEKCITDSDLSYKSKLYVQTIRKLIRQGKIKARHIPNGPFLILRKDNPDIIKVIESAVNAAKSK